MDSNREGWVVALILALGMTLGGLGIGHGLYNLRGADRFVTVKGVAERTVEADLALWPMRFVTGGNSLAEAQAELKQDAEAVMAFLATAGLAAGDIRVLSIEVTDKAAQAYGPSDYRTRFVLSQTILVRTSEVAKVEAAAQKLGDLVDAGVVLNAEFGGSGPQYLYTKLNDIKPAMIAEATAKAREAAAQFAADSGAEIGGIRQANQGLFQILARDAVQQIPEDRQVAKTVRVVTTIDYLLN
jgi:hypothetical protein